MTISTTERGIQWTFGKQVVQIELPRIASMLEDAKRKQLYALYEKVPGTVLLTGFSATGAMLFEVEAPAGFQFSYLTQHVFDGPAVVSILKMGEIDGWADWHFAISSTGELRRGYPAR